MLILTLKKGGGIFIGSNISIHLVEVQGHKIRLGIAAPKDIPVHREEIHNQIQKDIALSKRNDSSPIPRENREME